MTRGRMSPAVILALMAVLGFCLGAVAAEKPIYITKSVSPNAPEQTPDPNYELKEQMGVVENPGSSVPDYDPLGKVGPRKGPAPPMADKASLLFEGFEDGIMPPTGWGTSVYNPAGITWDIGDYAPFEGSYYATCHYDSTYSGDQDEWFTSPTLDFEGATTDLKLEFAWQMSYYWGVDPYDNYDLEVWISTDAGATFSTMLWSEAGEGLFDNWTWYEESIDLSAYVGEKDVVIGFRYAGYDGAQGSFDGISVNDDPPPVGRCCYGDPLAPSCDDMSQAACEALGDFISWDVDLNCTDNPCEAAGPGDNCGNPIVLTLGSGDLPYTDANQYTCGRGNDYAAADMCYTYGYGGGEDVVYEVTFTEEMDLIFTMDPKGTTWTYCELRTECVPPNGDCVFYFKSTGGDAYSSGLQTIPAGTYYMIIDSWPSPDCIPDFDLTIEQYTGGTPGDNCSEPLSVKLPDDLPYTDAVQTTCGRLDDYDATCLGSYDGGEDIIYQIDVDATVSVDITLDPKGTTYTGVAIGSACPLGDPCLATSTSSSGDPHGIVNVTLDPGTYYVMVDTWPSPDCIPDFDLTITESAGGPENDLCVDAIKIGEVVDLAFNTTGAGFDGGGTCLSSPNIWYCYQATCTGMATISLCGSSYDTKMAVYDGCACDPLGTELGCNDDACGLQSEVVIQVTAGQEYLIEVGGYGSNVGSGILNITCDEGGDPPPNDNCSDVTPTTLTVGTTETFTGNNEYATNDCAADAPATEAWEAFTLTEKADVTIDYCGTAPAFELVYIILYDACPCGESIFATTTDWDACGDGNITMTFPGLDAGTYYIPVLSFHPDYTTEYYAGDYVINVLATEWEADYCDASGGCDEYIERVQLGDIDNSSSCEGYGDFTDQIANLQFGTGYPITITIGNAYSSDYGAVWIDWNQDYDFTDAGEQITLDTYFGTGPYTGTITVPAEATPGMTRMRVRLNYYSEPGPCGATSYGEAEDYTINVGGEQSTLTIDPAAIDFGTVAPDATGGTTLTLGADGEAQINFDIAVEYTAKASIGGGQCDPTLRTSPFQSEGFVAPADKDPNQLLFEGFEAGVPPTGWSTIVNNTYTWESATYAPYEGSAYATCLYDETYSGAQDEWLITPTLDFAGSKYVLDFWWNGSYYWGVDPYDNCDLSVWISIDGGTTWLMELWNEDNFGEFTNWEWYNVVVDLSTFKDESNVKLAFVYTGYDGAQYSVDAVGINPAPLSWLSAAPASGSIPGNGTFPVTISYDATGLEEGLYEASLVITHTGASNKAVDMVPVTMEIGSTLEIDPWPMYALYAFAMEPMVGHAFVRDDDLADYPGYTVGDIDPASFAINGGDVTILGDPDFPAESFFDISFDVESFIDSYPLMWDTLEMPYTISGNFTDAAPFTINRTVEGIGHISGDANLDGQANVGDAVFLINYVFKDGSAPRLDATADANCDLNVNVADAVRLVNFIFRNGDNPCHP